MEEKFWKKKVFFDENDFEYISGCPCIKTELKYNISADYLQVEGNINGNSILGVKTKFEFEIAKGLLN